MKNIILLFLFMGFGLIPNNVNAHKINAAMSVIDVSNDGTFVEVTHRLYAHDLEHALDLGNVGIDFFQTKKGMELVKGYVLSRFVLQAKGKQTNLKFIGAEIDGDILYIYLEGTIEKSNIWEIDSNLLLDFDSAQTNYVNLHMNGTTQTLIFGAGQSIANIEIK